MTHPFLTDFCWRNRFNRTWWIIALAAFIVQIIAFKIVYPFANYLPDSYSYLDAAYQNLDVNMWPVAYSKFLRLISVFTHSDKILFGIQYLLMQGASLLFLFTLLYFRPPGKITRIILLVFVIANPVPLFIANYVSADSLFIALSLFWFTSLIWTIYRPRPLLILVHAILLLACFIVRYNAIYYPLISLLTYLLSRQPWKLKLAGILASFVLIGLSIAYTSNQMKKATGKSQFSGFGGWQLANNALYMYQDIPARAHRPVPPQFAGLEADVRAHMDTLKKIKFTMADTVSARFYLWSPRGPLIHYMSMQYKKDSVTPYFKRWGSMGPLYASYGAWLIRQYPWQFLQSFLLPNAVKFAVPPSEFLGMYNMEDDSVGELAKAWFHYKTRKVQTHPKKPVKILATEWYPVFSAVMNIFFVLGLFCMVLLNAIRWRQYGLPQLLALSLFLWLANAAFSILASPVTLRYQAFPILVATVVGALLIEKVVIMAFAKESKPGPQTAPVSVPG